MEIGIGSYTYGWEAGTYGAELTKGKPRLSPYELLQRAEHLGVKAVQYCVQPNLTVLSDGELETLKKTADDKGIEIELGMIGSDPDELMRHLRCATLLNAKILRTLLPNPTTNFVTEEAQFRAVLSAFDAEGVTIAVENHETYGIHDLVSLVLRADSTVFGVCLDSVNSLGRGEGIEETTATLLPYTRNLHLKDFAVIRGGTDMGFTITGTCLGHGRLKWEEMIGRLYKIRPDSNVILEQWTPFQDSIEETIALQISWAEEGIARLRDALSGIISRKQPL